MALNAMVGNMVNRSSPILILRQFLLLKADLVFTFFCSSIVISVLSNYLSTELFSVLFLSIAISGITSTAMTSGLDAISVQFFSRFPTSFSFYTQSVNVVRHFILLISALIVLPILYYLKHSALLLPTSILLLSHIFLVYTLKESQYIASHSFKKLFILRILSTALTTAIKLSIVFFDLGQFIVIFVFALDFPVRYVLFSLASDNETQPWKPVRPILLKFFLRKSLPIILSSLILYILLKLDTFMILQIHGIVPAGIYALADRLFSTVFLISSALGTVVYSHLLSHSSDVKALSTDFRNLYLKHLPFIFLISTALYFFSAFYIKYFANSNLSPASNIILPLFMTSPFIFLNSYQIKALLCAKRRKTILFRSVFALSLNFFLNLILIPQYGEIGAAAATLATYFFLTLVFPYMLPNLSFVSIIKSKRLYPL